MTALTLPSTGSGIAVDTIATESHQLMKMEFGAAGSATQVSAANPLPTTTPDISASGTLAAAAQFVNLPLNGQSSANIQITGTWTGTIQFEGTTGGVTFDPINGVFSSSSLPATTATVNGTYRITPGALASIQARMSVFGSGSATISIRASAGTGGTFANQVVPTKTMENGFVSVSNSSAVALGIGGVFTGTAEDVTEYADIRVFVFSDQASAVDGLQIQQSSNGTNWDVSDAYSIPAATGKVFSVGVSARFLRIVYTNGAAAQTALRLQIKLHKGHSRASSVRPQDARTNDNDMDEVLSHLMGYNGSGWDRMRGSIANGLVVDVTRIQSTINVAGTRNNNGTGNVAGSFHLTAGGSDGTNLRPLLVDTTGRLNVIGTFFQATQPVSGTFFQTTQPVSMASSPALNTSAKGTTAVGSPTSEATDANTQSQHVRVVNASFAVTGTFFQATQPVSMATAPTTPVTGTFFQTTQPVSIAAAQTLATVTTVSTVSAVASSTPAVSTTTAATLSSAAGTNATLVKGSAGSLYSVTASNVGAAAAFLKVFNLATAPTVGTSVPFLTIPIAASGVANINFGAQGMRMATGISFSITNLVADADATAIAAAQVKVAIAYI